MTKGFTDAALRRIDEEIIAHRQQIAGHQVSIMRLEDSRKVLMGLAEGDVIAEAHAKAETSRQIGGAHAQPMLIVRRTGSDEAPKRQTPLKNGKHRDYDRERKLAKARLAGKPPGEHAASASAAMRRRVVAVLKSQGKPMTTGDIKKALGIDGSYNTVEMKTLSNAVYSLGRLGTLKRNDATMAYELRQGTQ